MAKKKPATSPPAPTRKRKTATGASRKKHRRPAATRKPRQTKPVPKPEPVEPDDGGNGHGVPPTSGELLLVGGIDKRALARDRAAVRAEVDRTVPFMLEHGGWIPSVDHSVPHDVPLENYEYYLELVRGYM